MRNRSITVAAAIAAVFATSAAAEAVRQPPLQVTATRMPLELDEALASVSVISREEIERSGSNDLVDLLRREAGVDVARTGGLGQQTSVFLRGTNSNHVLVLIDGVRVASLNTGAYAFEQLPLGQVERIEIVRGPRAALYGSDAIGGVIQIFTRRPDGVDATVSAGNHDTRGAGAGFGVRGSRGGFGLRAGWLESGGINAQNPEGFAFDPDDDGLLQRSLSVDAQLELGSQLLGLAGLAVDQAVQFDQGETDVDQHSLAATVEGPLADRWRHRLLLGSSRDTLLTPAFFSRIDSRREQIDWLHAVELGGQSLLLGASHLDEHGVATDTFSGEPRFDRERDNDAVFASWRGTAGGHRLELGGRHDDNSAFGGETTWHGAWGWRASDAVRLSASYGEGFRAPNFNELFSPGFGGFFAGNPDLDAEHSRSLELGIDWQHRTTRLGLRAFRNEIEDLVDFSGPDFMAVNVREARIRGIEAAAALELGPWSVDANATLQDAEDRDSGNELLRRPPRKASVLLQRALGERLRLGLEGYAASSRPEFGGDLPGYGLLNLALNWRIAADWALDARIDNLLDRDYSLARGFNTPGQTVLVHLRWSP